MAEKWEAFKLWCDNQTVLTHDFSAKNSEFVTAELKRSITYTIEGFALFLGLTRQAFYDTYANNKQFLDIVTRIKEECELDARRKFELQMIPDRLAGLWMSRYGYSTRADQQITVDQKPEDYPLTRSLRYEAERLSHAAQ